MIFQDHVDYIMKLPQPTNIDHTIYLANCKKLNSLIEELNLGKRTYKKVTDGCRNMILCFKDGQRIRHKKSLSTEWIGNFHKETGTIIYNGKAYTSLGQFALLHYKTEDPTRTTVYGWKECETEVEPGKWISKYKLPEL
jgi:hypothetical protein